MPASPEEQKLRDQFFKVLFAGELYPSSRAPTRK